MILVMMLISVTESIIENQLILRVPYYSNRPAHVVFLSGSCRGGRILNFELEKALIGQSLLGNSVFTS